MRQLLAGILLLTTALPLTVGAQNSDKGALQVSGATMTWAGANPGRKIVILNGSYKRDSLGTLVTTTNPCTNPVNYVSGGTITPASHCQLFLRTRASDTNQSSYILRWYQRNMFAPDTTYWVRGGTNMRIWDSTPVAGTFTVAKAPMSYADSTSSFSSLHYPFITQAKLCVERVNVGSGDTVEIRDLYDPCW